MNTFFNSKIHIPINADFLTTNVTFFLHIATKLLSNILYDL